MSVPGVDGKQMFYLMKTLTNTLSKMNQNKLILYSNLLNCRSKGEINMAKERLTINELEEKKKRLIDEIARLKNFIESSDTSTFEIMIDDIKKQMHSNIAEEDWKSMKVNKGKIEEIRNVAKIIQNQSNLLEEKQDELDDVEWELKHYQTNLFEQAQQEEQNVEYTGIFVNGNELRIGDVFAPLGDNLYLLVKKSNEIEGKYAVCSNFFEDERMLQYPANLGLLDDVDYIGNIYDENNEAALNALQLISDYLQKDTSEQTDENREVQE